VLATRTISVVLSLALLVGVGVKLDFFWSLVAYVPVLFAVSVVVSFVALIVAPPKLELAESKPEPPNLSLFH
jgi:hypothetical protein